MADGLDGRPHVAHDLLLLPARDQDPGLQGRGLRTMMTPNYIIVNQDGKRFCNEAGVDFHGSSMP